jgi:hypothetical protein
MKTENLHPFWGSLSPLGGLSGAGIIIMASGRLAWAITVSGALLWVYILSVLASVFLSSPVCRKIFPVSGRASVFTCISCFFGSLYLLIFWMLCPLAAMEVLFPLLLAPLFCAGSGIFRVILSSGENSSVDIFESVSNAASEAAVLSLLVIFISLIREPMAFCSLTLPGTYQGFLTIISFNESLLFPVRIFTGSAGALLLLGYITGLYQNFNNNSGSDK